MARKVKLPKKAVKGERMRLGKRYQILSKGAPVGFWGTLVARFTAEGESWALFRKLH